MKKKAVNSKNILDLVSGIPELNYGNTDDEDRKHLDAIAILSLPGHLRKTAVAIHKRKHVTVEKLSEITGRDVEVERALLDELVEMKYLLAVQEETGICYKI